MDKIKAFYEKNKKIVIPVAIVLILLIAVGIYFVSQPNSDTNKKIETQTEEKADTSKDDKKEEDKNKDSEDKKADKKDTADNSNASAQNDNAPASKPSNNGNGSSNQSASKPADKPSQPAKPAHSHSWKNHTATKQVWVSKIVPVYETQTVQVGTKRVSLGWYMKCGGCGAEIAGGSTSPAATAHTIAHMEAGEPSNYHNFEKFTEKPIYETKQVQVGTKDEGHYETQSYTDYQYCDCGATR